MSAIVPPSPYSDRLIQCGVAAIIGVVLDVAQPGCSLTINFLCLATLAVAARVRIRSRAEGFDHVVAAEAIVAFGVFSLVLGLGSVLFRFLFKWVDPAQVLAGDLMIFSPFVEGLVTAGLAPIFAIWVRMFAAQHDVFDVVEDLDGLAVATGELVREMTSAKLALQHFGEGAIKAGASTHGLADTMRSEADKWALALVEAQAHVRTFGEASRAGSGDVSSLAGEVARLREAAAASATMLEELSRLIEQIERFVAPRSAGRR